MTEDEYEAELHRLYTVIDAQAFGFRIKEVALLRQRYNVLVDCLDTLDKLIYFPDDARLALEACKAKLTVLEAENNEK